MVRLHRKVAGSHLCEKPAVDSFWVHGWDLRTDDLCSCESSAYCDCPYCLRSNCTEFYICAEHWDEMWSIGMTSGFLQ
jgi:hypothetical protein